MPVIRFALSEEQYEQLKQMAEREGMTLQDYIRKQLFHIDTIYTAEEAVKRAFDKYQSGDIFTLPDLYEGEWHLPKGLSGAFGKNFNTYIEKRYADKIQFMGAGTRVQGYRAIYKIL